MTSRTLEVLERHSEAKRLIQYQRPAVYGVRDVPAARPVETVLLNLADPRPVLVEMDDQISRNPGGGNFGLGVSIARISQIEHGDVTSFEVIARHLEALGGRLDLFADFGDRTVPGTCSGCS
jgi:hypothetical protein